MLIINPINFNIYSLQNKKSCNKTYPNLSPLKSDTVSFGALKKREFNNFDFYCVEKFKAPIEKFNSNQDLQTWALKKIENEYLSKTFEGRNSEIELGRKQILNDWIVHLLDKKNNYNPTQALLVLKDITKDLKKNNDHLPPYLNQEILSKTFNDIALKLQKNKKKPFDFNKLYENNLKVKYLDTKSIEDFTGWVKIPSYEEDSQNFYDNVNKLKYLSAKTWCTRNTHAAGYLRNGAFYLFLENSEPKVAVRLTGNRVVEVQGIYNNNQLPWQHIDEIEQLIVEKKLTAPMIADELLYAKRIRYALKELKESLKPYIKENDVKAILETIGTKCEELPDGFLKVSRYQQPSTNYTFKDLGINENNLLKRIKIITGDAYFNTPNIKSLGAIERIEGVANFNNSIIKSLDNLKYIGSDANFANSEIKTLNKLEYIGGSAIFTKTPLETLGELKFIGNNGQFSNSNIKDLGKLEEIGGDAVFTNSKIVDTKNLNKIGENIYLRNSLLTSTGKITSIGGHLYANYSNLQETPNLERIDGRADFQNTPIKNLGPLKHIGKCADFSKTANLSSLQNIETIGDDLILYESKIKDLGKLKKAKLIFLNKDLKENDFEDVIYEKLVLE